jgi:phosphatidylserine synthase
MDPANLIIKIHFIIILSLLSFLVVHDIYWKHKDRDQFVMELTLSSLGIITVGFFILFSIKERIDRTKQKIVEYQHNHGDGHEKAENIT